MIRTEHVERRDRAQQAQSRHSGSPLDYFAALQRSSRPQTTLQNVNLSPDFPSVADVLLRPCAASRTAGRSTACSRSTRPASPRLLQLTGPVNVPDWPTPIDSGNVVQRHPARRVREVRRARPTAPTSSVTSPRPPSTRRRAARSASPRRSPRCSAAPRTPVTSSSAFTRPEEAAPRRRSSASRGRLDPVRSDAIAVTSSNFAGNKIDYYLQRSVDYRVNLRPTTGPPTRTRSANLSVALDNTAPAEGLPQIVIGPYLQDRFVAGENRTLLSMYSPLTFQHAARRRQARFDRAGARAGTQRLLACSNRCPRVRRSRRPRSSPVPCSSTKAGTRCASMRSRP